MPLLNLKFKTLHSIFPSVPSLKTSFIELSVSHYFVKKIAMNSRQADGSFKLFPHLKLVLVVDNARTLSLLSIVFKDWHLNGTKKQE
jgi:hypothetical protein